MHASSYSTDSYIELTVPLMSLLALLLKYSLPQSWRKWNQLWGSHCTCLCSGSEPQLETTEVSNYSFSNCRNITVLCLLTLAESAPGCSFGVRAQTVIKIWCVKDMNLLKLISTATNLVLKCTNITFEKSALDYLPVSMTHASHSWVLRRMTSR